MRCILTTNLVFIPIGTRTFAQLSFLAHVSIANEHGKLTSTKLRGPTNTLSWKAVTSKAASVGHYILAHHLNLDKHFSQLDKVFLANKFSHVNMSY